MTNDATTQAPAAEPTGTTNGPDAPAIAKPKEKRPETRVRDALRLAEKYSVRITDFKALVGREDAIKATEEGLAGVEEQCRLGLARARALRDFAREIQGLTGIHIGTLKGGLDSLTPAPR